jgi:flavin reductase (DIM6/NTAB) family NADH-FMN oxidoreductase RutF
MRQPIDVRSLALQPFTTFDPSGVLLVAGTHDAANLMTISWGSFGICWGRPVMMAMVRPTRHTWEFITASRDFTVNWLNADREDALTYCGTVSGRDADKAAVCGLTYVNGGHVDCPILDQAELALECRTLFRTDIRPEQFLEPALLDLYKANDYHGLFFGEIIAAAGIDAFRQ